METATIQTTEFETSQTTDPREAKLKEIIEKGKASLQIRKMEERWGTLVQMQLHPISPK